MPTYCPKYNECISKNKDEYCTHSFALSSMFNCLKPAKTTQPTNCDIAVKCISKHKNKNCKGSPFNFTTYCFKPAVKLSNLINSSIYTNASNEEIQLRKQQLQNQIITRQKLIIVLQKNQLARFKQIDERQSEIKELNKILIKRMG